MVQVSQPVDLSSATGQRILSGLGEVKPCWNARISQCETLLCHTEAWRMNCARASSHTAGQQRSLGRVAEGVPGEGVDGDTHHHKVTCEGQNLNPVCPLTTEMLAPVTDACVCQSPKVHSTCFVRVSMATLSLYNTRYRI
jgi:hypothetical protein